MDICQLFDLYGSQDLKKRQIAFTLSQQPQLKFNFNSLLFFVYHYLDQYDYIQPQITENDYNIKQTLNICSENSDQINNISLEELSASKDITFDDILPILSDIQYKYLDTIKDPLYNSREDDLKTTRYIQHLLVFLMKLQDDKQNPNDQEAESQIYIQVKQQLAQIDSSNQLQIDEGILRHFARNMESKLNMYEKQAFKDSFVQQLLLLQKCLGMVFQDRQYNYVYVDSFVFASQQKQRQIQNNLKIIEKQNYSTYIFCPKCKQKKCIALGERQTTLGGDELTRIVYLCKECNHRFKK